MQGLMKTLYCYAQERWVASYLQTREYHRAVSGLEGEWDVFREALTAEQEKRLEELLARQFKAGCLEDEATFLAGLSVGLELARL